MRPPDAYWAFGRCAGQLAQGVGAIQRAEGHDRCFEERPWLDYLDHRRSD